MSEEIYDLKQEAENKIYNILRELEKATGLYVSDISYEHHSPKFAELTKENYYTFTELNIKLSTL